jgi:hypothetical protein
LQSSEVLGRFSAILSKLGLFLTRGCTARTSPSGSPIGPRLAEHVCQAVGLLALFRREAIRFATQRIELAGRLLLLLATQ